MGQLDLEILTFGFQLEVDFFKPEVNTLTHKKNFFLNETIVFITKIYTFFKSEQN